MSKNLAIAGGLCATSSTTVTGVAPPSAPPPLPPPVDPATSPPCRGCGRGAAASLAFTSITSKRHGGRCDTPRRKAPCVERIFLCSRWGNIFQCFGVRTTRERGSSWRTPHPWAVIFTRLAPHSDALLTCKRPGRLYLLRKAKSPHQPYISRDSRPTQMCQPQPSRKKQMHVSSYPGRHTPRHLPASQVQDLREDAYSVSPLLGLSSAHLIDPKVRVESTQQGQRRLRQASILLVEIHQMCGVCGRSWRWRRRARCRSSNRGGVRSSGVEGATSALGHALRSDVFQHASLGVT